MNIRSSLDNYTKNELRADKRAQGEALNRIIGQRLLKARAALGLRATDVCEAFPLLNKSHLSVWESGQKQIPTYWLRELSNHYGVSLDYVVGDIDDCEEVRTSFLIQRMIMKASNKYIEQIAQEMNVIGSNLSQLIEAQNLSVQEAKSLCVALERVKQLDQENWENMRGGAPVESAIQRFKKSLNSVEAVKRQIKANKNLQISEDYQTKHKISPSTDLNFEDLLLSVEKEAMPPKDEMLEYSLKRPFIE